GTACGIPAKQAGLSFCDLSMESSMRTFGKLMVAGVLVFAALQLVRPGIPAKPATAELQAPPEVKRILQKDCYSCHSDERLLAWFDQIVPRLLAGTA
ncbi:MAG: heme-binding domain-containing protein, partial [Candidatus Sulfotelmatobacter sp.]